MWSLYTGGYYMQVQYGPSLSGHSAEATLSNVAINLCRYYYECIHSPSPKATSLVWPQFLGKQVVVLEREFCSMESTHLGVCKMWSL